jgi:3-oxoacyl-[acyl-carrier protein] reductase
MDLHLKGKTALVTGSFRGTGLIIAKALLDEGATTILHGMKEPQAEEAVKELGAGRAINADITTQKGCTELLEKLSGQSIDILVNNYGAADPSNWQQEDPSPWFTALEKNVLSAQRLIQGLVPKMIEKKWGRVINLGTTGATKPSPKNPAYYSSKGALNTMTISLAGELSKTGITVNIVSPGLILTPEVKAAYLARAGLDDTPSSWEQVESKIAKDIPIGRIVRREEVANLITYLCSPHADAIHGQNIKIDGGSLGTVS